MEKIEDTNTRTYWYCGGICELMRLRLEGDNSFCMESLISGTRYRLEEIGKKVGPELGLMLAPNGAFPPFQEEMNGDWIIVRFE